MATVKKKQTSELVPYSGADQTVDLGSQNLTTSGTITAGSFVGPGSGSGAVDSVNGATGVVVLDTDDISEGATNKYFSTELAQDAVGTILVDSSSIDFTYNDTAPSISANIINDSITASKLAVNAIPIVKGGTGQTNLTDGALLEGNGSSGIAQIGPGTANQIVGENAGATANEYKTLAVGTTGTDFAIDHSAGGITFNLPSASVSNRGAVTTGAQTFAGVKTFSSIPVLPAADPTTANQATRKSYVDAIALTVDKSLLKLACRTVAITNGNLSTAYENGDTVNGVIIATNDRIMLNGQTDSAENGIYVVNASGAPTRANDYDVAGEVVQGSQAYVTQGNSPGLYVMISPSVTTLGTDPINFTQIAGLSEYNFSAGTDGTDFNVDTSGMDVTYNLPTASATNRGALSDTDWSTFNGKIDGPGTVVDNKLVLFDGTTGKTVKASSNMTSNGTALTIGNTANPGALSLLGGEFGTDGVLLYVDSSNSRGLGTRALIVGGIDQGNIGIDSEEGLLVWFNSGGGGVNIGTVDDYYTLASPYTGTVGQVMMYQGNTQSATWADVPQATDIQIFTSNGTWTKPGGTPKTTQIIAIGGGGGGGAGRKGAAGFVRCGGGGGGAGGWGSITFPTSILGSTETVTVGTGGAGAAAQTTNTTNGAAGTNGGNTTFGSWFKVEKGQGGFGGTATNGLGGTGFGTGFPDVVGYTRCNGGGAASASGAAGGTGSQGRMVGSGGGAGGGITTGNIASLGGAGGAVSSGGAGYGTTLAGGTAGATSSNGGAGNASPTNSGVGGSGGGGGGSSITTNAGAGGNGALYGAGGGGGGAATNSIGNSGAGGNGADGFCIVITNY